MTATASTVVASEKLVVSPDVPFELRVDRLAGAGRVWSQLVLDYASGHEAVVVVTVSGDQVAIVRQWRHAVGAWVWELPRGFGQSADPREDACREAREELGVNANAASAEILARFCADTGYTAGRIAVVAVEVADRKSAPTDVGEVAEVRWVSAATLRMTLVEQPILDGISLVAESIWSAWRGGSSVC